MGSVASVSRGTEVRERIFRSSLRLFSERGFAATSLREIAVEAETTKPMIYYYFGSKEALYGQIVHEILEEMAASIVSALDEAMPPAPRVLAFCGSYLDYFLANEDTIALVLREVFGLGGAPMASFTEALGADVRRPLDETLRAGIAEGVFHDTDVVSCATAITGILNMFILAHVFAGADIDPDTPLHQVGYYVAGLLKGGESPKT